jgi:hypothetical protein
MPAIQIARLRRIDLVLSRATSTDHFHSWRPFGSIGMSSFHTTMSAVSVVSNAWIAAEKELLIVGFDDHFNNPSS